MSARDELALLLANAQRKRWNVYPLCDVRQVLAATIDNADAIFAAGYRKPRTITTAEELDALPEGAVIRDNDGDVFEAVRCTGNPEAGVPDYNCWDQIAETWPMDSEKIGLPAIVLDEADQ